MDGWMDEWMDIWLVRWTRQTLIKKLVNGN
jgi:hypothetical protein